MPLYNIFDASRITRAITGPGTLRMDPWRRTRNIINREYGGMWYGSSHASPKDRDPSDSRPINLMYQFVRTYLPNLVGPVTKVKVKPRSMGMAHSATMRELMINEMLREMRFSRTWRSVVQDALTCGLGIARTGIRSGGGQIKVNGEMFDMGQPYVVRVDLDDFVRDPDSRDPLEDRWRAFRYRVRRSDLVNLGIYDEDMVMGLPDLDQGGTETKGESHEMQGGHHQGESLDSIVELWDVLYYENDKVLEGTLAGESNQWLVEPHEYEGRQGQPLTLLSLLEMPNNAMPVAPAAQLLDLHLGMASLGQKMLDQAIATKMGYVYRDAAGEETAQQLQDTPDQTMFKGDPTSVAAMKHGGMMPELIPAFQFFEDQANKASALHLLAGSEDPSNTATVGTFMQGNASVLLNDWRGLVNSACTECVNSIAWYYDTDPTLQMTLQHKAQNGSQIDMIYDPQTKEGNFTDFLWDVEPYVETSMDPSLKLRRLSELMTALPALAGVVMQLGGDMSKAIDMLAEQYQIPELGDIFPTQQQQQRAQMMMQLAGMPSQGTPKLPGGVRPSAGNRPIDQTRSDMASAY